MLRRVGRIPRGDMPKVLEVLRDEDEFQAMDGMPGKETVEKRSLFYRPYMGKHHPASWGIRVDVYPYDEQGIQTSQTPDYTYYEDLGYCTSCHEYDLWQDSNELGWCWTCDIDKIF
jgi:hypothetical protein